MNSKITIIKALFALFISIGSLTSFGEVSEASKENMKKDYNSVRARVTKLSWCLQDIQTNNCKVCGRFERLTQIVEEIGLLKSRIRYLMYSPFSVFQADAKALHKYLLEKSDILAECVVTLENDPNRNAEIGLPYYDPTQDAILRGTENGNELVVQGHKFRDNTIKPRADQSCDGCLVMIPVDKIEFSQGGETPSFVAPLNTETQDSLVSSSSHCQDPDQSLPGKQTQKVESDKPELYVPTHPGYQRYIVGFVMVAGLVGIAHYFLNAGGIPPIVAGVAATRRQIAPREVAQLMQNAAVYQGYAQ